MLSRQALLEIVLLASFLSAASGHGAGASENKTGVALLPSLCPELTVSSESGRPLALFSREAYRAEFRYLRRACHAMDLSGPASRMTGLQSDVPQTQWPFMQFCYFGFACLNLAECDPESREETLREARWLVEALQTPRLTGFIGDHFGPPFGERFSTPSVFVHGLFLNLAVRNRAESGDQRFDPLIHRIANALSQAFARSEQGVLPTYTNMWWITDNLPALSALARYDLLFHRDLSNVKTRFLRSARAHYLDTNGLIGSYIDPLARRPLQCARGVEMGYALHFLKEVDPEFAQNQFALAKREFFRGAFGFAAVRELPEGVKVEPDVDSGAVVFNFGAAASGFGIGAAAVMGDKEMAVQLLKSSAWLGMPTYRNQELRYAAMPPVGQAVILFGKTELLKLQLGKSRTNVSR
jgi:hypothetical protein